MAQSPRQFKDAVYGQLGRIGKALSSPRRLELIDVLSQGERTVEELAGLTGQSLANTSHHLKILRQARLVESTKRGLYVHCRLAGDDVGALWRGLRQLGEARLAEIAVVKREFLADRDQLDRVDTDALVQRVRDGEVWLLDLRPAEEFAISHLPGAQSMPLDELEQRIEDLPRDQQIVAYCRGPYCVFAVEAVKVLRQRGFEAVRLEDGVAEWSARGLEVVR